MTPKLILRNAGDASELLLYGTIGADPFFGEGVGAKEFRAEVQKVRGKLLNLRINSPGGSTVEASAMVQALDEYKAKKGRIEVDVDGVAASAASYIACVGDTVRMAQNALLMIHDPHGVAFGGAAEMRRTADLLDTVREQIITMYQRRTKLSREDIAAAMSAETWYDGAAAMKAGFADSVSGPVQLAAFAGMEPLLAKLGCKKTPQLPGDAEAWAETEKRRAVAARLRESGKAFALYRAATPVACGGEGSGVPGPCPGEGGGKESDQGGEPAKYDKPNKALPSESRPALTESQAKAIHDYTADEFKGVNDQLREGKEPTGKAAEVHAGLTEAFKNAKPFDKPVTVHRGVTFKADQEQQKAEFINKLKEASQAGKALQFGGYSSTSTNANDLGIKLSDIRLEIQAVHGLDVKSFSQAPEENELLLNNNSKFTVEKYEVVGKQIRVKLKQVLS